MTDSESQISWLISDPISVNIIVEKLEGVRLKGNLRINQHRQVLRSFFVLNKNSREIKPGKSINARTRTLKLCGFAKGTVPRLVTSWIDVSRSSLNNTITLSLFVNQKPETDCDTVQSTIVSSNDAVFQETRDFGREEKAERVQTERKSFTDCCMLFHWSRRSIEL